MKYTKYSKYVADLADELSLEDLLNALSDYLLESGFQFRFPDWPSAAQDLVQRWRKAQRSEANEELASKRLCDTARAMPTQTVQDSTSVDPN